MKRKRPPTGFWTVLTAANVLALIYPSNLLLRANSLDEHLFATLVLIISVFLLASLMPSASWSRTQSSLVGGERRG